MSDLDEERSDTLNSIDRRRFECDESLVPSRAELQGASSRALRRLASSLRASAWGDRSSTPEEAAADFADDPGWAPNGMLRVAALVDHLSELGSGAGTDLPLPSYATPHELPVAPAELTSAWETLSRSELAERLDQLDRRAPGVELSIFDAADRMCIARASSWRGEVIDILDLKTLESRLDDQQKRLNKEGEDKKQARKAIELLEGRPRAWAEASVRAGFARPHFGPHLTTDLFRHYVVGRQRLDVTADLNAIISGIVHHIARIAPRVDFARSAITDLEIQRLADHDRSKWRKACRTLEALHSETGSAWRALRLPDATALLVARADQKGEKAPGADALLGHNFEEGLRLAFGVKSVLLTSDNGLARTVAARLPAGSVWVGYVDSLSPDERFISPLLSWPKGLISESRYSSLAELMDELLVCGVTEHLIITDGTDILEIRAHFEGEHQYINDWQHPKLLVRTQHNTHTQAVVAHGWPLRTLVVPAHIRQSKARATVEQVANALEWVRATSVGSHSRDQLPLIGDARDEVWNFLRAVNVVDDEGRPVGRDELAASVTLRNVDFLRSIVLRFEPVARITNVVEGGARNVVDVRTRTDLGERTFGAGLVLAIACGLVWRNGEAVGPGKAFVSREEFMKWLFQILREPSRISVLAEVAARELHLSPVRFCEALGAVIDDPRLEGARGGSAENHNLDSRVLTITRDGHISIQQLKVDDLLGLRSLAVRK